MGCRSIRNHFWWFRLWKGLFPDNSVPSQFTSGIVTSISSLDNRRLFSTFSSHVDLFKYVESLTDEEKCLYEVIIGDRPQKMKFDVDIKGQTLEFAHKILDNLLESVDAVFSRILSIDLDPEKNILIYQSHGADKFSFHVVIDRYSFMNAKECEYLFKKTVELMSPLYSEYIDQSVYKSVQQFRLLLSHKLNSSRTKHLMETFEFRGRIVKHIRSNKHKTAILNRLCDMTESLVSWCSSCIPVNVNYTKVSSLSTFSYQDTPDIQDETANLAFDAFLTQMKIDKIDSPFQLRSVRGNFISLKRLRPSYCHMCDRVHEAENPYLTISNNNNLLFYHCRRNIGKSRFITELYPEKGSDVTALLNNLIYPLQDKQNDTDAIIRNNHEISEWVNRIEDKIKQGNVTKSDPDNIKEDIFCGYGRVSRIPSIPRKSRIKLVHTSR